MKYLMQLIILSVLISGGGDIATKSNSSQNSSTNDSGNVTDNSIDNSVNSPEPGEGVTDDVVAGSDDGDGVNPSCSGRVQGVDGQGGFLWKPVSEGDGFLVILFPEAYDSKFLSVSLVDLDGNVERGTYAGSTNGDRQTWRFNKVGGEYTGRITVDATTQECIWQVANPSIRQD